MIKMSGTALITTTVNNPRNLLEWAKSMNPDDDIIIVSGDMKTPHSDVKETLNEIGEIYNLSTVYMHPDNTFGFDSHSAIGFNTIQRRNVALLHALTYKPDMIVTVDDDNFPTTDDQISKYREFLFSNDSLRVLSASDNWYNVGESYFPSVIHRGYPIEKYVQNHTIALTEKQNVAIGVVQSLWIGDPDIGAIERIHKRRSVNLDQFDYRRTILDLNTWCPFNSQATAFKAELAPLMMMWTGVGRYDDIFASYAARAVMDYIGLHVMYGLPMVEQNRNEHNLLKDLSDEMYGYHRTYELTEILRNIEFKNNSLSVVNVLDLMRQVFNVLIKNTYVFPTKTEKTMISWLDDLNHLASANNVNFFMKRIDSGT